MGILGKPATSGDIVCGWSVHSDWWTKSFKPFGGRWKYNCGEPLVWKSKLFRFLIHQSCQKKPISLVRALNSRFEKKPFLWFSCFRAFHCEQIAGLSSFTKLPSADLQTKTKAQLGPHRDAADHGDVSSRGGAGSLKLLVLVGVQPIR